VTPARLIASSSFFLPFPDPCSNPAHASAKQAREKKKKKKGETLKLGYRVLKKAKEHRRVPQNGSNRSTFAVRVVNGQLS